MTRNPFEIAAKKLVAQETNVWGQQTKKYERQPVAQSQKRAVFIKQNGKCALCHKPLIGSIHYDHINPVHKGGKSTTENLRAICASCHDKRHILDKAKEMDKKRLKKKSSNNSNLGFGVKIKPIKFKEPTFKF